MSASNKKSATDKAAKDNIANIFEAFSAKTNGTMKENIEKFSTAAADAGGLGKENFEALVEAGTTYSKGMEALMTEQASFTKEAVENTVTQMRQIASVKTPQDFFEMQSEFMRSAFEANISQFNKLSQMWVNTARQSAEPLGKRYNAVVEKVQSYS